MKGKGGGVDRRILILHCAPHTLLCVYSSNSDPGLSGTPSGLTTVRTSRNLAASMRDLIGGNEKPDSEMFPDEEGDSLMGDDADDEDGEETSSIVDSGSAESGKMSGLHAPRAAPAGVFLSHRP